MYPFKLKAALAGAKVVTRGGEPVTQLHFFDGLPSAEQPIVGVVDQELMSWGVDGRYQHGVYDSMLDLFMAEAPEQAVSVPKRKELPAGNGTVNLTPQQHYAIGWNDCIDAWLAAAPKPEQQK